MTSFGNDALIPTSLFITSPAMRLTYDFCGAIPTPGTRVMGNPCMASDCGDFAENFYRRNPVTAFPVAFTGGCPKPEQTRMGKRHVFSEISIPRLRSDVLDARRRFVRCAFVLSPT